MSAAEGKSGSKRRRISLACHACRTRKSRCDGQRPRCSACEELDYDCVYVQSASSSNVIVRKDYLGGLEQRLTIVENRLNNLDECFEDVLPSSQQRDTHPAQHKRTRFEEHESESLPGHNYGFIASNEEDNLEAAPEDSTDGMGAMVFTDEEDSAFFGPSSNIAFTRQISQAMARLSHLDQSHASPGMQDSVQLNGGLLRVSRPPSPSKPANTPGKSRHERRTQKNLFVLPPDSETLELVQRYFSNTGLLFPYIHEETFLETYDAMKKTNFTKVRKTWLALLNMVLAFAISTTVSSHMTAGQRVEMSHIYYERASGLCDKQIWRGTSIELLQYLLMRGQYLQGTQKAIEAWNIHGLAVKAALQLGLHSTEASRRFPPLEQEIRKRLWFGCVILDRTLSMTFGRPASIPGSYVRLELPVDFDTIVPTLLPGDRRKSYSTLFFNATITLYKVTSNVIDLLYGSNIHCETSDSVFDVVARLFKMEHELAQWVGTLPASMSLRNSKEIPSDGHDADVLEQYRIIITLRYHNLRILIHRLVVGRFLDICGKVDRDEQELALLQQIGSNSVQICFKSSLEIISIVNTIVHSTGMRRGFLGAWWFSLYYTFNAALVVFACILVAEKAGLTNPPLVLLLDSNDRPLDSAADALMLLDKGNRMVDKCASFLDHLSYVLSSLTTSSSSSVPVQRTMPGYNPAAPNTQDNLASIPGQTSIPQYPSPLGLDLGEFMMENDLNFSNWSSFDQH